MVVQLWLKYLCILLPRFRLLVDIVTRRSVYIPHTIDFLQSVERLGIERYGKLEANVSKHNGTVYGNTVLASVGNMGKHCTNVYWYLMWRYNVILAPPERDKAWEQG